MKHFIARPLPCDPSFVSHTGAALNSRSRGSRSDRNEGIDAILRRIALALLTVFALGTPGARALPGFELPDFTDIDILDPCDANPELCEPPPPTDPCDRFPGLCNPVIDPPVDPGPTFPRSATLQGRAILAGDGLRTTEAFSVTLSFDDATFLAVDTAANAYTGRLVAKGKKLKLFLDDGSTNVLAGEVAGRALVATGLPGATVAGGNAKLTLRLRDDGSASLKIKAEVFVSGIGVVTFKANLAGPVTQ